MTVHSTKTFKKSSRKWNKKSQIAFIIRYQICILYPTKIDFAFLANTFAPFAFKKTYVD